MFFDTVQITEGDVASSSRNLPPRFVKLGTHIVDANQVLYVIDMPSILRPHCLKVCFMDGERAVYITDEKTTIEMVLDKLKAEGRDA
jgi:hypothetical protein